MTHEQILELADSMSNTTIIMPKNEDLIAFAEAIIYAHKAELLKEVGEPVAYMTTDEEGSASMLFFDRAEALKYSGDDEPVKLFTESQLLAVLAKKDEEIEKLRNIAVTETNNARYWKDAHDEVCEGLFAEQEKNRELRQQLKATQEEWNQCSGLLDDAHRSIEMLEDQLATAEQRVAEVTALNPMLEILDPARRLFIIANLLELKYLPIYADQPDPTYITKWVWEVRDQFGASICEAHEWLYQAIDNAYELRHPDGYSAETVDWCEGTKHAAAAIRKLGEQE